MTPDHSLPQHETTSYPEVVPVENLKANVIRHQENWNETPHRSADYSLHTPYTPYSPSSDSAFRGKSRFQEYPELVQISTPQTKRRRPNWITIGVALCTFIVTALAVGAGLGVPLRQCREQTDTKNYLVLPADQVLTLRTDSFCDSHSQLTRNPVYDLGHNNASYDLHCGLVFQAGAPAYDPTSTTGPSGTVRNIMTIITYDVDDCIRACDSMNVLTVNADPRSPQCQSITFVSQLQNAVKDYHGNCFLKNSTMYEIGQAIPGIGIAVSAEVHGLRTTN